MKAKFVSESLKQLKEDFYDNDIDDEMLIQEEPPISGEEIELSPEEEAEMQDEFETALKNELTVPEYSRRTVVFRVKGQPGTIEAIPMAKMKDDTYLMKIGDVFKKFNINDIIEESFKSSNKKRLNEGSYDDFLTNYGSEIKNAIVLLKKLQKKMMNGEISEDEFASAMIKLEQIYDVEVMEFIDGAIFGIEHVDTRNIANTAIENMNINGTEMSMILNAIDDIGAAFGVYADMPEDYE